MWQTLVVSKVLDLVFKGLEEVGEKIVTKEQLRPLVEQGVAEAVKDPVVQNETNGEPWYKSRTFWHTTAVFLAFLATTFGIPVPEGWADNVVNIALFIVGVGGFGGFIYSRFKSGLAPLFTKKA